MKRFAILLLLACLSLPVSSLVLAAMTKGIYLTQGTLENTDRLEYLIERSKAAGINTFIVDLERPSKHYEENIQLLKENNISYVARIVVFPDGGTPDKVKSPSYWKKRYELVKYAVSYGANQIQLDYIRYNTKQPASSQNAKDIQQIIQWFKDQLAAQDIELQIDVFGVSSFGEAKNIGQNIKLFSTSIDSLCPMVYPSHYEPFRKHAVTPYETVHDSLLAIRDQFDEDQLPFKLIPYIELSNYRYKLSQNKKLDYIYAQIHAAEDAGADGWYAWSPHNQYDNLFKVMESYPIRK